MSADDSSSLTNITNAIGTQSVLKRVCKTGYKTSDGTDLYRKILVGSKPILFPTVVSRNTVFEYIFSIKDLIMPDKLPDITDLFIQNIVVKFQDLFTQACSDAFIKDGKVASCFPFVAVLAQDENGIEKEVHVEDGVDYYVVNSSRIIMRDSSPIFAVSTNLKFEKYIDLTTESNTYRPLAIVDNYVNGVFEKRITKPEPRISPDHLKQIMEGFDVPANYTGPVYRDFILCDILIFCSKSYDPTKKSFEELTAGDLEKPRPKREIPFGWLSDSEKLDKLSKSKNRGGDGEYSVKNLPVSKFVHVDMTATSEKIYEAAAPKECVFLDEKGVIAGCPASYIVSSMMMNVTASSQ